MVQKWKNSIVNHMYWCASSTDDDDPDLKEAKWLSITNHIMNRHSGHENPLIPQCAHGRLHGRERKKKWLKPGTCTPEHNYFCFSITSILTYDGAITFDSKQLFLQVHRPMKTLQSY